MEIPANGQSPKGASTQSANEKAPVNEREQVKTTLKTQTSYTGAASSISFMSV